MAGPEGFLTILTTSEGAAIPTLARLRASFVHWWLHDYPPLDGRLRLLVYGGLLALALYHPHSPLRGIGSYGLTDPAVFRTFGLLELLRLPHLPYAIVAAVVAVTAIAWAATAVGLFTRATAIVTAAGAFLLHGYFWGSTAFDYDWYLAIYVLGALAFAGADPVRSADGWIARRQGRAAPARQGIGATGFPRKLALVCVVSFYFLAGVTKLQTSGLAWADGETIAYWATMRGGESARPVIEFGQSIDFTRALSITTLVVEAMAPLVLLFPRLLWIFIPGWMIAHLALPHAIGTRYFTNMICFLAIIYWHLVREEPPTPEPLPASPQPLDASGRRAIAAGVAAMLGTLTIAAFQINWWPFSNVYMLSAYYSVPRAIRAGYPLADYGDAAAVQRIAADLRDDRVSFEVTEHLPLRGRLWLTSRTGERHQLFSLGAATPRQWDLVIERPLLIDDLASKPPGNIAYDPASGETPANRLLATLVPVVYRQVPDWGRFERLELTYSLAKEGRVVVASVPLHAPAYLDFGR